MQSWITRYKFDWRARRDSQRMAAPSCQLAGGRPGSSRCDPIQLSYGRVEGRLYRLYATDVSPLSREIHRRITPWPYPCPPGICCQMTTLEQRWPSRQRFPNTGRAVAQVYGVSSIQESPGSNSFTRNPHVLAHHGWLKRGLLMTDSRSTIARARRWFHEVVRCQKSW
jgi:hypothetical protein